MKKGTAVVSLVVALGLLIAGGVYAWWPGGGYGMGYQGANPEAVQKFQTETLSLRQALSSKYIELQNEYSKPTPDTNRIATLQKEIIDLQAKIQTAVTKHGISTGGPMGGHMGGMMMGPMMGQGMMMGPMMDMCPMMGW